MVQMEGWHGTERREQPPARQLGTGQQMEQAPRVVHALMREPGGVELGAKSFGNSRTVLDPPTSPHVQRRTQTLRG